MELENLTFEQANAKLESAVSMLESGKMTLDETLKVYKEACLLLDYCCKQLEKYKGEIKDINEKLLEKSGINGDLQ